MYILGYLHKFFLSCQLCFRSFSPAFCVIFIQVHAGSYFYNHKTESFKEHHLIRRVIHKKRPFAHLCCCHHFYAGLQSDQGAASQEAKHEESPKNAVVLRLVSEVSTVELVALSSPQISPSPQLSDAGSDTSTAEVSEAADASAPIAESGSHTDVTSTNGEHRTDEDKDPKQSKAHLHCPVCKVTVNSISQLEAHNSGTNISFYLRVGSIIDEIQTKPGVALLSAPGTKHKLILEGHSVLPRRRGKVAAARVGKSKRLSGKGSVGAPSKTLQCEVCEIFVNSETQLSQVRRMANACVRPLQLRGIRLHLQRQRADLSKGSVCREERVKKSRLAPPLL